MNATIKKNRLNAQWTYHSLIYIGNLLALRAW